MRSYKVFYTVQELRPEKVVELETFDSKEAAYDMCSLYNSTGDFSYRVIKVEHFYLGIPSVYA